ncbi:MAG: indolepyruvate oxidoreductase subunit beta [Methanobacteriaceae archaeon]
MNQDYTIYICGVGGQGIIKTSVIIGEAAMNEGLNVVMSEIHGMSQRGGVVSTELKIGNFKSSIIEEDSANMILSFEPSEAVRGLNKGNKDTAIVYNINPIIPSTLSQTNQKYPDIDEIATNLGDFSNQVYSIEGEKIAKEVGNPLSINMVLLGGAIAVKSFPLSKESIVEAMKNNFNPKFAESNLNALEKGIASVEARL